MKLKYIVLALIYAYVLFMAFSGFGWMGVVYVLVIPLPFVFFSYIVRKRKKAGHVSANKLPSIWFSPIPYLALILLASILFRIFG